MICFQFSIFELPETTIQYIKHLLLSCDLLSIQYIWTTRNNSCSSRSVKRRVVICFQFSIFELPETTWPHLWACKPLLWFAFNSVYLNYQKQHGGYGKSFAIGCDLLSIQYIWTTRNNPDLRTQNSISVVICFQFSIFELPETTVSLCRSYCTMLWFAFNSVYLNYQKQLDKIQQGTNGSCDLLSIQYIWTTRNNSV